MVNMNIFHYDNVGYRMAMPIFSAKRDQNDNFDVKGTILGTCFPIGNDYFMTAGHVLNQIPKNEGVVCLHNEQNLFKGAPIVETEILSYDLGLFKVEYIDSRHQSCFDILNWSEKSLFIFDKVRSLGYPYGLTENRGKKGIAQRGFEGTVVVPLLEFSPPGSSYPPFAVYELSFPAPRGLSGAPLLSVDDKNHIAGIIIGNSSSSIEVFSSKETEGDKAYEVRETMSLAVAVQEGQVFLTKSKLLGKTIGDHLKYMGLLSR